MKVVLVNDQLNAGGAEKVIVTIANLLYAQGVDVSVVLFLNKAALDDHLNAKIPVSYLKRKGRFDFKAMQHLKKLVNGAEIVHVHSRYNLRYFIVAKYFAGIHHPKVVFHEHVPQYANVDFVTSLMFKKIDAYVAVLNSITRWAATTNKVDSNKIFYLPNIVSKPHKNMSTVPSYNKKIIMVANFRRIKNHLFAIELLKNLSTEFTLDLYGMIDEQEYYQEVKNSIEENHLQSRVKIIHGVNNLYDVMPKYDFAIHTAVNETGPLVLLEYINIGIPFLTYKTGDVVDEIGSEIPETVLDTFDIDEWTNRIKTVMMTNERRENLQRKIKRISEKKFSEEVYLEKLMNIYKSVLN